MTPLKFNSSLGVSVIVTTIACFIGFVGLSFVLLTQSDLFGNFHGPVWIGYAICVFIWVIFITCYGMHPTSLEWNDIDLVIKAPFLSYRYRKSEIRSAKYLGDSFWAIRTFGVGGLFGNFGKFYNRSFGSMTWYATQRKNYVLLEFNDGFKLVVTPDDPKGFIDALSQFPN